MAEIGYISLIIALLASIYSIGAYIFGSRTNRPAIINSANKSVLISAALFTISAATLVIALVTHQFQIEYVALYSSSHMTLPYLISALWAGNAGSLLFWGWIISLAAAVVVLRKRMQGQELVPYASMIIMVVQAFFLLLLIFAQNPFTKLDFMPADGRGLNPLLENPGMIFHPPALLGGYAIFVVPFAFAIAALISRKLGKDWLVAVRRWTLFGWLLLGAGNLIGAWWAYAELGWGGYWGWDPVENAGLMPWLLATAFVHSIMIQKRKGVLKLWSMLLIILTFILIIFGTFITRSDILGSVHTFGETAVSSFFLAFLITAFAGSLSLLFYRRKDLKDDAEVGTLFSREGAFLLNNIFLFIATFVIFWGTIFPIVSELISGTRINVATSYFNQVAIPFLLAIVFLSGICVLLTWRQVSTKMLRLNILWSSIAALVVVVVLVAFGMRHWYALIVYFICSFVFWALLSQWFREIIALSRVKAINWFKACWSLLVSNRSRYGGLTVHIAIIIITIGVVGSSLFDVERDAELLTGESMTVNSYVITFNGLIPEGDEAKMTVTAELDVYKDNKFIGSMRPQVTFHSNFKQPVSEVAIRSTLSEDLYLILASWETITLTDGSQTFKAGLSALVNPLVIWIWIGGGIFLLGGLVAFWPGRRD
ncbi:MAG: heme lyase CcmF/NrfE family subunit [Dehalococcoidia bacterium]|nr:MAG: heme lyase CcmF/NrfE family subunit [Dehalococcoidia bacterium]